jgi:putative molybdopterin biosynthesis protein
MQRTGSTDAPLYLTTREVAELLRVKERKIYDLAAAGEIPHRRITGKLLFPRDEILSWIEGSGTVRPKERPAVITGSHDPLLEWAIRESGSGLATLFDGSIDGLDAFEEVRSALTGLHIPEPDGWNEKSIAAREIPDCVLIGWAVRTRGLLVAANLEGAVDGIADLKGRRVALRQPGAGATALMNRLLSEEGLDPQDVIATELPARTENDAASSVAAGEADAALGIEAMARRFSLRFLPLTEERFDLLVDRRSYFTQPVQALLTFASTEAFQKRAASLGGYDVSMCGVVRWVSA